MWFKLNQYGVELKQRLIKSKQTNKRAARQAKII
jgi:hypothetical protein